MEKNIHTFLKSDVKILYDFCIKEEIKDFSYESSNHGTIVSFTAKGSVELPKLSDIARVWEVKDKSEKK